MAEEEGEDAIIPREEDEKLATAEHTATEEPETESAPPSTVEPQREPQREYRQYRPIKQQKQKPYPTRDRCKMKCNLRIDELAMPNRRQFLDLWKEHAHHFPPEKCKKLRRLLQEMYAMSPEDAQKYFDRLHEEARMRARRRKIRAKIKSYLKMKRLLKQRQQAYAHLWRLIRALLHYALTHKPPVIKSARLMIISNVILEQLCEIMELDTLPDRANPDRYDEFMIRIADWAAIAAENLYYQTQMAINTCLDCLEYGYDGIGGRQPDTIQLSAGQTMVPEVIPDPWEQLEEVDDRTGVGAETRSGNRSGMQVDNRSGNRSGMQVDNRSGNRSGMQVDNRSGNRSGMQVDDRSGVATQAG